MSSELRADGFARGVGGAGAEARKVTRDIKERACFAGRSVVGRQMHGRGAGDDA